jgi:hypothetical protein
MSTIESIEMGMNNLRNGWYGWQGYGGSVMQWHPEHKIGFAYVPNDFNGFDFSNMRAAKLQSMVVNIVTNQIEAVSKPGGDDAEVLDEPDEVDDDDDV